MESMFDPGPVDRGKGGDRPPRQVKAKTAPRPKIAAVAIAGVAVLARYRKDLATTATVTKSGTWRLVRQPDRSPQAHIDVGGRTPCDSNVLFFEGRVITVEDGTEVPACKTCHASTRSVG